MKSRLRNNRDPEYAGIGHAVSGHPAETGGVAAKTRLPLFVVLDDIRSVYNTGAIFRTSDAVRAEKIFLCGITANPPRKDLEKTALGATSVVEWEYRPSTAQTLLKLKENGVKICALELTEKSIHFKEAEYPFPLALVLGNEVAGVSREILKIADFVVSIPMLGRAKSLNVATAYGIVAYEILHQYEKKRL